VVAVERYVAESGIMSEYFPYPFFGCEEVMENVDAFELLVLRGYVVENILGSLTAIYSDLVMAELAYELGRLPENQKRLFFDRLRMMRFWSFVVKRLVNLLTLFFISMRPFVDIKQIRAILLQTALAKLFGLRLRFNESFLLRNNLPEFFQILGA
jgi:hypothetical protein